MVQPESVKVLVSVLVPVFGVIVTKSEPPPEDFNPVQELSELLAVQVDGVILVAVQTNETVPPAEERLVEVAKLTVRPNVEVARLRLASGKVMKPLARLPKYAVEEAE